MADKIDYKVSINRARRRRNRNQYQKYFIIGGIVIILLLLGLIIWKLASDPASGPTGSQDVYKRQEIR